MHIEPFLPAPQAVRATCVQVGPDPVTIFLESILPAANCPCCQQPSSRVHSHYHRKLADLPWQGKQAEIRWQSRKFFCDTASCPRRIFTERIPELAASYARKTARLVQSLRAIGFACGGESGSRLAAWLEMPASADSLLRILRRDAEPSLSFPRVLGVDEWAFRRGHHYGTILCDLERHCVVDLLPDRSSDSFATWLASHPGVEVIARDRADYYAQGAAAGAPEAVQVVDRWHLLRNVRDALARVAERYPQELTAAAQAAISESKSEESVPTAAAPEATITPENTTREERWKQQRRAERLKRYEQVRALGAEGLSQAEIACQTGLYRGTVARFLHASSFPERAQRQYPRQTDSFAEYLHKRWEEGCHSARQLTDELKAQGFNGSYDMVRRRVAKWRDRSESGRGVSQARRSAGRPSSRRVAWLLIKPESDRNDEESLLAKAIFEKCSPLETAAGLACEFIRIVQERRVEALEDWVQKSCAPEGQEEMGRFAKGLQEDWAAVQAALQLPWSNGQTEGQVNRLKLIKRQMYGRAKFDLLRQRVLHVA